MREPRFRDAVENFLGQERGMVRHEMDALTERGPYRKAGDGGG